MARMKIAVPRRGLTRIASTRQSLRALLTTTTARTSTQHESGPPKRRFDASGQQEEFLVPSLVDQVESMEDEDDNSSTDNEATEDTSSGCHSCQLPEEDDPLPPVKRLLTRRRQFRRWIPAYLCRNLPSLIDEAEERSSTAADLPSDSFIGVAPSFSAEQREEHDTASSLTTTSSSKSDTEEPEDEEHWREVFVDDGPTDARRVRFAPMVKKIQFPRHVDRGAVWWTREDRRRTIEEASNEINVYIRQFPETFRTIILLCQNEMKDYTTLKQIMPVRGLLRPCLNRLSREDVLVRNWVQNARKSVSHIVRLQATDISVAHYTTYSMAAARMALYVAQADARAVKEDSAEYLTEATNLLAKSSSETTFVGPSERVTV